MIGRGRLIAASLLLHIGTTPAIGLAEPVSRQQGIHLRLKITAAVPARDPEGCAEVERELTQYDPDDFYSAMAVKCYVEAQRTPDAGEFCTRYRNALQLLERGRSTAPPTSIQNQIEMTRRRIEDKCVK